METSVKGIDFIFDCVNLLYCINHKINLNRGGSYVDSPDWIKNKKTAINHVHKNDNKYFQYAVTIALNHEEIKKNPQIILKIKPFISKCNWEGINCPSRKDNWKTFEKNNPAIALNVLKNLYIP